MKKVAIIDKNPSRVNYKEYFEFEFEVFHMSDVPIKKLLKKDVTLVIDTSAYDLVILVGAEAAKEYAKITSVSSMMGHLVENRFVAIPNPAMLIFKPEGKQDFLRAISKINDIYSNNYQVSELGDFKGINDTQEAIEFLTEVLNSNAEIVAWDTETTALYPRDGYVIGISMSYKVKHGRYISTDCLDDECLSLLQKIADKYPQVEHNMKFDIKMLKYHLNIKRNKVSHDTMLMHYLLDENSPHGLKHLALKFTNYGDYDKELDEFKKEYCRSNGILQEDFTYDLIPFEIISRYAAIDTAVTLELYNKFWPIIKSNDKLFNVYNDIMTRSSIFLMNMEEEGIPFSKYRLELAKVYLDEEIEKAKNDIYSFEQVKQFEKATDSIFNPNSPKQLRTLLFDYIGLNPTAKKTATGAISTDADVLTELSKSHPIPKAILKVRKLSKMRNTYIDKLLSSINKDGKVRTNFNNTFTTSGRLSSSGKFNAQQIPRDDPIIKSCIVAPEGYTIVSQDLATGEVYIAAVLSGDKELQKVFQTGGDLHSAIAKTVFNLKCNVDEVKKLYPALRQAAKAITFGILYGASAGKVAESVTEATGEYYSLEDAEQNIRDYFTKFKTLKKWLDTQKDTIKSQGFVYSFFGRKRRLPNVFSSDKAIASHEVRSGINSLIQSTCSDVNLLGAMDTQDECDNLGVDAKIFMLVHDSIVALVKDDYVEQYCRILKENTQKDRGCSIPGHPIGIDQDIGKDYSFGKFEEYYEVRGDKLARLCA